jgi:hypothetical protein
MSEVKRCHNCSFSGFRECDNPERLNNNGAFCNEWSPDYQTIEAQLKEAQDKLKLAQNRVAYIMLKKAQAENKRLREELIKNLEVIFNYADHQIPYYGYGDCEAACDMANRLSAIREFVNEFLSQSKNREG